jgi:hypothetical protein
MLEVLPDVRLQDLYSISRSTRKVYISIIYLSEAYTHHEQRLDFSLQI